MIEAILALIAQLAPVLSSASQIASVITTLENIISIGAKEIRDVIPMIKNIIAALQSNGNITAEQMAALKALDEATDADFEAAAKDAGADPEPA